MCCRVAVRREDTAYRTGPEHFCFILPGTDPTGARVVCQRLEPLLDGIGMLRGDGILAVVGHLTIQHLELGNDRSVEDCLREVREGLATDDCGKFQVLDGHLGITGYESFPLRAGQVTPRPLR